MQDKGSFQRLPVLLMGYDVEASWDQGITRNFLKEAQRIHMELNAPCTMFVTGQTLEKNIDNFQNISKYTIFDIQQHTYSHVLLKTVCQENEDGITVWKGGTLEQIKEEVAMTNELLMKYLNVRCIGITGPYGYYRGLSDRPDILKILYDSGIRFTRTYGRNEQDWQPVSMEIQPFWYGPQGFPEIMEFPFQGWQDNDWRERHGWHNTEDYLKYLMSQVDYIISRGLVWCHLQHDRSSIKEDPRMMVTQRLLEYARQKSVKIVSYKDYYLEEYSRRNLSKEHTKVIR